ncbi:NADPH-dependent FMN reductase [Pseudoduganella umbonata]|uniref:NAD(P)H-dependent FMN reductase n=1 Tax=Pseudoduganella umbonata TaxID=864828 RepID=A0A4P8HPT3_9BURK|nr:NAD(P)H-dependent oxidoreductase [Pseudoduganella umbonata]MBB3221153.1 NAD(P)H-dependent FMN reductase [Pseudoduganella umbonata]QCP10345.1 NAD(P)H-dependent oxidoreductase [Pseudoduganella umbonata]
MTKPITILAFAGSTRRDSLTKKLSRVAAVAAEGAGAHVTWIDLKDYPIPLYDGDTEAEHGPGQAVLDLLALFRRHDALLIASPEYNGFFPPLIKNTLDWLSRPREGEERHAALRGKHVLLLSAARGSNGGARGLQQLRHLFDNFKAHSHAQDYLLPAAHEAFDEQGNLAHAADQARLEALVAQFAATVRERQLHAA